MSDQEISFYSDKPEWKDVKPIPLITNSEFLQIDYTPEFIDVMGYFRAIAKTNEMSARALELTFDILSLNIANYTVWHFRRRILIALKSDLLAERDFVTSLMCPDNTKNYQSWYHRQWMVEQNNDFCALELEFSGIVIQQEPRNLHAWQYRLWLLKRRDSMSSENISEIEFTQTLIENDPRNNSAWNHRFYLLFGTRDGISDLLAEREIEFTFKYILKTPNNESPWNYLTGIVKRIGGYSRNPKIVETLRSLKRGVKSLDTCPYFLSTLSDCAEELSARGIDSRVNMEESVELYLQLAAIDSMRAKYWTCEADRVRK